MCELMGYSFAKPIVADFSIREFGRRDEDNADGWGLAWYPDRAVAVVKESNKWRASKYSGFLETYADLRSHLFIAHVRHGTVGKVTYADTHPFARELDGCEYCFAHNGTLQPALQLPLGRFQPLGTTDSEHFFCHLLNTVAAWNKPLADPQSWPRLHHFLTEHNRGGTMNLLFSDGRYLFGYFDAAGWKGLYYRYMLIREEEKRCFDDPDVHVELGNGQVNFGIVVATCPLSSSGWNAFLPGELLVLEGGAVKFSSHRANLAVVGLTKAS